MEAAGCAARYRRDDHERSHDRDDRSSPDTGQGSHSVSACYSGLRAYAQLTLEATFQLVM